MTNEDTQRQETLRLVESQIKPRCTVNTYIWRAGDPRFPPWLDVRLLEEAFRLGLLRPRQLGEG